MVNPLANILLSQMGIDEKELKDLFSEIKLFIELNKQMGEDVQTLKLELAATRQEISNLRIELAEFT